MTQPNPFRIHGVVDEEYFTDRADELNRILKTLREPSAKLLVYGPRRMGKTSAIARAIARHQETGGVAFLADISTVSTLVDVANRILEASGKVLGAKWSDAIVDLIRRIGVSLTLTPDAATGLIVPSLDVGLRSESLEEQRTSLSRVLDSIDALAAAKNTTIGIALDEFQEIQRFGGTDAEWHLRGIIQHHQHVSYILAGSQAHIIERMLDKGRAFYQLADHLAFGPIEESHLARWIDERMIASGVGARDVGQAVVAIAGPRTRDVVQVARQCFDNCRASGQARPADVEQAFKDVVAEQESLLQSAWSTLTPLQQNVLRAVAAGRDGLTAQTTQKQFGLSSSGSTANAAAAFVDAGQLLKSSSRTGYSFESPFFRSWVTSETLADLGALRPSSA